MATAAKTAMYIMKYSTARADHLRNILWSNFTGDGGPQVPNSLISYLQVCDEAVNRLSGY